MIPRGYMSERLTAEMVSDCRPIDVFLWAMRISVMKGDLVTAIEAASAAAPFLHAALTPRTALPRKNGDADRHDYATN